MPLSPKIAVWLTQQGHNALHASQCELARASDATIMQQARRERRILITADLDFPRLFALTHAEDPGLILLRGGNYTEAETSALVHRVLQTIPLSELTRSLVVIDHTRIRKIALPF